MHFCSQCGHDIPHREKFCQSCGTRIEYLCALPPLPPEPAKRREVHTAASVTKWIIVYLMAIVLTFGLSYLYYSSPDSFTWKWPFFKSSKIAEQTQTSEPSRPSRTEVSTSTLKAFYNQLTITVQKSAQLGEDQRKANVPGDPKRTAANYRTIQRASDGLLAQLTVPPDLPPEVGSEVGSVVLPLKECLSLLNQSASIMADYLEGKLSLSPPNPDWVARSQEYYAQSQARFKQAQQALASLKKRLE